MDPVESFRAQRRGVCVVIILAKRSMLEGKQENQVLQNSYRLALGMMRLAVAIKNLTTTLYCPYKPFRHYAVPTETSVRPV
eukprot:scaffold383_cov351-Pavlova_lutheri.AAC.15